MRPPTPSTGTRAVPYGATFSVLVNADVLMNDASVDCCRAISANATAVLGPSAVLLGNFVVSHDPDSGPPQSAASRQPSGPMLVPEYVVLWIVPESINVLIYSTCTRSSLKSTEWLLPKLYSRAAVPANGVSVNVFVVSHAPGSAPPYVHSFVMSWFPTPRTRKLSQPGAAPPAMVATVPNVCPVSTGCFSK